MTLKKAPKMISILSVMKVYLKIFCLFLKSELYYKPSLRAFIFAGDSIEYQLKTQKYDRSLMLFMSR